MQLIPLAPILIVDDMQANLLAARALVQPLAHPVVTAASGHEALELATQFDFAVILLDVMMPVLDGLGTLERLRAIPRAENTPVIFLTAYTPERSTLQRAYQLGAFDFVEKPVLPEILRGKISAFLALHQQSEQIKRQGEALRAKDRHLGVLAHDLRTPLSVIVTMAKQLADSSDPSARTAATRVARSSVRMERLIEDLLTFAMTAEERFVVRVEAFDLCELCCELVEDAEAVFPAVSFTRDLPSQLLGRWDRARLEQAVANLITNAAKHGDGWVSMRLVRHRAWVELTIANGGEVIPTKQLDGLFAPFVRGPTRAEGVGLGLHIARDVARAHGGDVHAESDERSTRFTIRLPIIASELPPPP